MDLLAAAVKSTLDENPKWKMRAVAAKVLFKTEEDHELATTIASKFDDWLYNPTTKELSRTIMYIDEHEFLFRLSGNEDVKHRTLEMYREDAICLQAKFTKRGRAVKAKRKKQHITEDTTASVLAEILDSPPNEAPVPTTTASERKKRKR